MLKVVKTYYEANMKPKYKQIKKRSGKFTILMTAVAMATSLMSGFSMASLTVKAEDQSTYAADTAGKVIALDQADIDLSDSYTKAIYNDKQKGLYIVERVADETYSYSYDISVSFYDLDSDTLTCVYKNDMPEDYTIVDDKLYGIDFTCRKLSTPEVVDDVSYNYTYHYSIFTFDLNTMETSTLDTESFYSNANWGNYIEAIGVDGSGRFWVSDNDNYLRIFDSQGQIVTSKKYEGSISQFYGFDETNGNFYYQGQYNWKYWGYSHYMASLMAGNIDEDNNINLPEANLMILYQKNFYFTLFNRMSNDSFPLFRSNLSCVRHINFMV